MSANFLSGDAMLDGSRAFPCDIDYGPKNLDQSFINTAALDDGLSVEDLVEDDKKAE